MNTKDVTISTFAVKYIGWFVIGIIMSFITTGIVIYTNDTVAEAMDLVMQGQSVEVKQTALFIAACALLGAVTTYLSNYFTKKYGVLIQTDLKNTITGRIPHMEYAVIDEKGSGELLNHLVSDIREMDRLFSESLPEFTSSCIVIVATLGYMTFMDWRLAAVIIVIYPVLLVLSNIISNKVKKLANQRRGKLDERTQIAYDCVQGIVVGKSYNLEERNDKRIGEVIEAVFRNERKRTSVSSLSYVLEATIGWIPVVVCYIIALFEVINNAITPGDMLAFSVILGMVSRSAENIPMGIIELKEAFVSIKRLSRILNAKMEESGTFSGPETDIAIEFEGVEFAYNQETPILKGVDFKIKKGTQNAIVGSSGGGKTTIFKLLTGYYRPDRGTYRLYGTDYRQWDLVAARSCFSIVSQNVFLLPQSIYENVSYARPDASFEEVVDACKNANINDFIMSLPQQYDTQVMERGVRLSGGERQRISIARAFLKNAPILLLDEPTAAIDVDTEQLIQEAIERISRGKTVIIIAHRLNTIENVDNILVMNNGKVEEQGTHTQLLNANGVYANLYGRQMTESHKEVEDNG